MTQLTGIELIAQERQEQHGWKAERDKQPIFPPECEEDKELLEAALVLLEHGCLGLHTEAAWPWEVGHWQTISRKSNIDKLAVAGALIAAAIDRLQRRDAKLDGGP